MSNEDNNSNNKSEKITLPSPPLTVWGRDRLLDQQENGSSHTTDTEALAEELRKQNKEAVREILDENKEIFSDIVDQFKVYKDSLKKSNENFLVKFGKIMVSDMQKRATASLLQMAENNDEQIDVAEETNHRLKLIYNNLDRLISQVMESNKILKKGEEREEQNDKEDKRKKKNQKEDETEEKRVGRLYKMIFGKTPAEIREEKKAESKAKAGQRAGGLLGVGGLVETVLGGLVKYGAISAGMAVILGPENTKKITEKLLGIGKDLTIQLFNEVISPMYDSLDNFVGEMIKDGTNSIAKSLLNIEDFTGKASKVLDNIDTNKDGKYGVDELAKYLGRETKNAVVNAIEEKKKNLAPTDDLPPLVRQKMEDKANAEYFGEDGNKHSTGGSTRGKWINPDLTAPSRKDAEPLSPYFDDEVIRNQIQTFRDNERLKNRNETLENRLELSDRKDKDLSILPTHDSSNQSQPPLAEPVKRTSVDSLVPDEFKVKNLMQPVEVGVKAAKTGLETIIDTAKAMDWKTVAAIAAAGIGLAITKNPSTAGKILLGVGGIAGFSGGANAQEPGITSGMETAKSETKKYQDIGAYVGGLVKPRVSDKTVKMKQSSDLNKASNSAPIIINKNDNSRTSINSVNSSGSGRGNDLPRPRNPRPAFGN